MIGEKPGLDLDMQRRLVTKSLAQGRRWMLRSVILVGLGGVALYRGNSLNTMLGVALVVLGVLAFSLGKNLRRQAADLEAKMALVVNSGGSGDRGIEKA